MSKATSEYGVYTISRDLLKLIQNVGTVIDMVVSDAVDEGDRAYFGSTNHLDYLKEIDTILGDWHIERGLNKVTHVPKIQLYMASKIRNLEMANRKLELENIELKRKLNVGGMDP